ncbi:hypothetical protein DNTS_014912, partial [Danionella cerebrum]
MAHVEENLKPMIPENNIFTNSSLSPVMVQCVELLFQFIEVLPCEEVLIYWHILLLVGFSILKRLILALLPILQGNNIISLLIFTGVFGIISLFIVIIHKLRLARPQKHVENYFSGTIPERVVRRDLHSGLFTGLLQEPILQLWSRTKLGKCMWTSTFFCIHVVVEENMYSQDSNQDSGSVGTTRYAKKVSRVLEPAFSEAYRSKQTGASNDNKPDLLDEWQEVRSSNCIGPKNTMLESSLLGVEKGKVDQVDSARQASLEWAKKQMAGDSISHQCENMSSSVHPPEHHLPEVIQGLIHVLFPRGKLLTDPKIDFMHLNQNNLTATDQFLKPGLMSPDSCGTKAAWKLSEAKACFDGAAYHTLQMVKKPYHQRQIRVFEGVHINVHFLKDNLKTGLVKPRTFPPGDRCQESAVFVQQICPPDAIWEKTRVFVVLAPELFHCFTGPNPPQPRKFYLLPKIHKSLKGWTVPFEVPPGRPIVSDVVIESYRVAKYIDHFLNPLYTLQPHLTKPKAFSFLWTKSLYTNIDTTLCLSAVGSVQLDLLLGDGLLFLQLVQWIRLTDFDCSDCVDVHVGHTSEHTQLDMGDFEVDVGTLSGSEGLTVGLGHGLGPSGLGEGQEVGQEQIQKQTSRLHLGRSWELLDQLPGTPAQPSDSLATALPPQQPSVVLPHFPSGSPTGQDHSTATCPLTPPGQLAPTDGQHVRNLEELNRIITRNVDNRFQFLNEISPVSLTCNDFTFKKFDPTYVNIYMAEWERTLFSKLPHWPSMYLRFLDDIFGNLRLMLGHYQEVRNSLLGSLTKVDPADWNKPKGWAENRFRIKLQATTLAEAHQLLAEFLVGAPERPQPTDASVMVGNLSRIPTPVHHGALVHEPPSSSALCPVFSPPITQGSGHIYSKVVCTDSQKSFTTLSQSAPVDPSSQEGNGILERFESPRITMGLSLPNEKVPLKYQASFLSSGFRREGDSAEVLTDILCSGLTLTATGTDSLTGEHAPITLESRLKVNKTLTKTWKKIAANFTVILNDGKARETILKLLSLNIMRGLASSPLEFLTATLPHTRGHALDVLGCRAEFLAQSNGFKSEGDSLEVESPSMVQKTAMFRMTAFICPLCPPDSVWRWAALLKKSVDYVCDVSCHSNGSPPVEPRCRTPFIYSTLRISPTALARRGQTPQCRTNNFIPSSLSEMKKQQDASESTHTLQRVPTPPNHRRRYKRLAMFRFSRVKRRTVNPWLGKAGSLRDLQGLKRGAQIINPGHKGVDHPSGIDNLRLMVTKQSDQVKRTTHVQGSSKLDESKLTTPSFRSSIIWTCPELESIGGGFLITSMLSNAACKSPCIPPHGSARPGTSWTHAAPSLGTTLGRSLKRPTPPARKPTSSGILTYVPLPQIGPFLISTGRIFNHPASLASYHSDE